jgi:hypothetical protein
MALPSVDVWHLADTKNPNNDDNSLQTCVGDCYSRWLSPHLQLRLAGGEGGLVRLHICEGVHGCCPLLQHLQRCEACAQRSESTPNVSHRGNRGR